MHWFSLASIIFVYEAFAIANRCLQTQWRNTTKEKNISYKCLLTIISFFVKGEKYCEWMNLRRIFSKRVSFVLQNHVCSIDVEHLVGVNRHQDTSNVCLWRKQKDLCIIFCNNGSLKINLTQKYVIKYYNSLLMNYI